MKFQIFSLFTVLLVCSAFATPKVGNKVTIEPTYSSQFGEEMYIEKTLQSVVLSYMPFSQVALLKFDLTTTGMKVDDISSMTLDTMEVGESMGPDGSVSLYLVKTIRDYSKPDSTITGIEKDLLMKTEIKSHMINFDLLQKKQMFWDKEVYFMLTYEGINEIIVSSTKDKTVSVANINVSFGSKIPPVKTAVPISAVGYSGSSVPSNKVTQQKTETGKCVGGQCKSSDCDCKCNQESSCSSVEGSGICGGGKRLRKSDIKGVTGGSPSKKFYPSNYYYFMGEEAELMTDVFPLDKARNLFAIMAFDLLEINKIQGIQTAKSIKLVTHCFLEKGKTTQGFKLELHLVKNLPPSMEIESPKSLVTELLVIASPDSTCTFNIDLTQSKDKFSKMNYLGIKFQSSQEEIILQSSPPMTPIMYLVVE